MVSGIRAGFVFFHDHDSVLLQCFLELLLKDHSVHIGKFAVKQSERLLYNSTRQSCISFCNGIFIHISRALFLLLLWLLGLMSQKTRILMNRLLVECVSISRSSLREAEACETNKRPPKLRTFQNPFKTNSRVKIVHTQLSCPSLATYKEGQIIFWLPLPVLA